MPSRRCKLCTASLCRAVAASAADAIMTDEVNVGRRLTAAVRHGEVTAAAVKPAGGSVAFHTRGWSLNKRAGSRVRALVICCIAPRCHAGRVCTTDAPQKAMTSRVDGFAQDISCATGVSRVAHTVRFRSTKVDAPTKVFPPKSTDGPQQAVGQVSSMRMDRRYVRQSLPIPTSRFGRTKKFARGRTGLTCGEMQRCVVSVRLSNHTNFIMTARGLVPSEIYNAPRAILQTWMCRCLKKAGQDTRETE